MKSKQKLLFIAAGLIIIGVGGFYLYQKSVPKIAEVPSVEESLTTDSQTQALTQLANPASTNCSKLGGNLMIQKRSDGGEYGVCFFENNKQCEEWALLRGDCPAGGLEVSAAENNAEIFCLITGGKIEKLNTDVLCRRTDGTLCAIQANFNGDCPDPSNPTPNAGNTEASSTLELNDSIYSEELGIKVSYYSNPENRTSSKVDGQRIYFYMNGPVTVSDYQAGQFLEKFDKEATLSFSSAIENKFLQNISKGKCFVKIIEDTANYQKAIIDYPNEPCPNGSPAFTCNSCPANYSRTNGIAYFIYYKNHPETFFYFSIGQYSLMMGSSEASSSLEWFNNLEFVK